MIKLNQTKEQACAMIRDFINTKVGIVDALGLSLQPPASASAAHSVGQQRAAGGFKIM